MLSKIINAFKAFISHIKGDPQIQVRSRGMDIRGVSLSGMRVEF